MVSERKAGEGGEGDERREEVVDLKTKKKMRKLTKKEMALTPTKAKLFPNNLKIHFYFL